MFSSGWLAGLGLLFGLGACGTDKDGGEGEGSDSASSETTDLDGDGYGTATDCDDSSAAIHPGGEERCNNLDDNCDGEVDEAGAVGGVTAYPDGDGDGWGAGSAETVCPGAAGYLYSSGDCDDADLEISPSASETCDGVDNDCDGLTDEPGTADGTVYFLDQDLDGYGHPVLTGTACAPGDGYAEENSDCDDGDPSRNPGEPELCSNEIDDDCDGETDEPDADSPTWYRDADGDNYGDDTSTVESCERPDGYAHSGGDCDDTDDDVYPGACDASTDGDGVDSDCSGTADDGDSCASNTGIATYLQEADGDTLCRVTYDNLWSPVTEMCDGCIYGWDVEFAYDPSASEDADVCGYFDDTTLTFSFQEDYYDYGSVLWYYYPSTRSWYPVWLATLDDGHLEWDATYSSSTYRYGWYGYADLDL